MYLDDILDCFGLDLAAEQEIRRSKKLKVRPLNDVLLVRPDAPKTSTKGGIHLPKPSGGPFKRGTVLSTGPGKLLGNGQRALMPCRVDDIVLFASSKEVVVIDGQKCCLIRAGDVLAVEARKVKNV